MANKSIESTTVIDAHLVCPCCGKELKYEARISNFAKVSAINSIIDTTTFNLPDCMIRAICNLCDQEMLYIQDQEALKIFTKSFSYGFPMIVDVGSIGQLNNDGTVDLTKPIVVFPTIKFYMDIGYDKRKFLSRLLIDLEYHDKFGDLMTVTAGTVEFRDKYKSYLSNKKGYTLDDVQTYCIMKDHMIDFANEALECIEKYRL